MLRISLMALITMMAFAANSLFCRIALRDSASDPSSFTVLRLLSGAFVLSFLLFKNEAKESLHLSKKELLPPICLFLYALFFSLSYTDLSAGTGALLLFASVQLTMMAYAFAKGTKLNGKEKAGFALASGGLIYLLLPQTDMPSLLQAALMVLAGVSWGIYTLAGLREAHPTIATARNFVFSVPLAGLLFLATDFRMSSEGVTFAVLSGAVTSGMGYILWYSVLKKISTSTAAVVQLSVPALAAAGGIIFLGEKISLRFIVASTLILGGIYLKVRSATK